MAKAALKRLSDSEFEHIAAHFRALSEVSRLRIVAALQSGEHNVTELVEITGLSQPNVSRHLQILLNTGLVERKKRGLNALYQIADESLMELCGVVCRGAAACRQRRLSTK
ncbi:MAG: metalloregulator ArsR/SmtB family transcription factor [Oligoflexia bacterium]|nr:metalloregulator ArsR/SmtB family transcription factor [Oligoflexia bacterium]